MYLKGARTCACVSVWAFSVSIPRSALTFARTLTYIPTHVHTYTALIIPYTQQCERNEWSEKTVAAGTLYVLGDSSTRAGAKQWEEMGDVEVCVCLCVCALPACL